jgi:large repetitive protein
MKKHILYYNGLVKRYNKYQRKLDNANQNSFHRKRIDIFIKRLRQLYDRINNLGKTLKTVAAGSTAVLALMLVPMEASAQTTYSLKTNRLMETAHAQNYATPAFGDIDGDGDLDLVIGERYPGLGAFVYINEDGKFKRDKNHEIVNLFKALYDSAAHGSDAYDGNDGMYSAPAFADFDDDGDDDLFVGEQRGIVHYFQNDGGTFALDTANNPLKNYQSGEKSKPTFVDLDADGDLDVVIGKGNGEIRYLRNDDGVMSEQYSWQASSPFSYGTPQLDSLGNVVTDATGAVVNEWKYLDAGDEAAPAFADLDGDGDLDAYVGNKDGDIIMFANIGSATSPKFALDSAAYNHFGDMGQFYTEEIYSLAPVFVDLDADGDMDMPMGFLNGPLYYFENNPDSTFTWHPANNLGIADISNSGANSTIADVDEDGDLDIVMSKGSDLTYFENNGTGMFAEKQGGDNPLDFVNQSMDMIVIDGDTSYAANYAPTWVDWNGDMYGDLFVGTENDTIIHYYENVGDGTWTDETYTSKNPFLSYKTVDNETLVFIDLDGDGDLDSFVGNKEGKLKYFENDGAGKLVAMAGPFDDENLGGDNIWPAAYDVDGDGDLDMFIGKGDYVEYYVNDGDQTFTKDESNNPFGGITVVANPSPAFGDLNGDGVQDMILGDRSGNSWFFEGSGTVTAPVAGSVDAQFAIVGLGYSFDASDLFTDANNDIVQYRAKQPDGSRLPAWLTFNRTNQQLTGTPSAANVGSLDVVIEAVDVDNNIAVAEFTLNVTYLTGMEKKVNISFYPNPTVDKVNVKSGITTLKNVNVYSLSGVSIKSFEVLSKDFSVDMSDLPKGIYLIKVNSAEGEIIHPIIKK